VRWRTYFNFRQPEKSRPILSDLFVIIYWERCYLKDTNAQLFASQIR